MSDFQHPDFEFLTKEYPSTDGKPYYQSEAAQDEQRLTSQGWIRCQGVYGDSKGIVVVYRRKKNAGA